MVATCGNQTHLRKTYEDFRDNQPPTCDLKFTCLSDFLKFKAFYFSKSHQPKRLLIFQRALKY